MKITEILNSQNLSLSYEVFPPKTGDMLDSVCNTALEIAKLSPSFMSVTYGAGGGTSKYTLDIAKNLRDRGVTSIAHLTCASSTREQVHQHLCSLKEAGIENILALRGDIPKNGRTCNDYKYACELVEDIKKYGDFCIGGACYPECHPESNNSFEDIENLKRKVEAGVSFLTTQMFFDNNIYYNFLYRLDRAGVNVPVIAGIMPVVNPKSIKRICHISGTALPQRFVRIVDRFADNPEALRQAGVAYATEQIIDLYANGVKAVHIYSMNKLDIAKMIMDNVSEIIKC